MKNRSLILASFFLCFAGFAQNANGSKVNYKKAETQLAKTKTSNQVVAMVDTPTTPDPTKAKTATLPKKEAHTKIKIIESYERVLEKGYKTEAMLQAVADYRYFADDFVLAAKWYTELFEYCPEELAAVYYFRYAKSLHDSGQLDKAKEMMALYQLRKN